MRKVRVRLDTPNGLLELPPGRYVVGRSPDCDVVIASGRASRQHARIEVDEAGATIEDLGAANGTFVNGAPVRGRRALLDADFVVLGDVAIEVAITTIDTGAPPAQSPMPKTSVPRASSPGLDLAPEMSAVSSRQSVSDLSPVVNAPTLPTPTHNLETIPARAHEVLAATAAPFFEQQQLPLAEKILEGWLLQVLGATRTGAPRDHDGDVTALQQGARLARALTSPRWLDYCLELAAELSAPIGASEVAALETVARQVGVSEKLLEGYLLTLQHLPDSEGVRACLERMRSWRAFAKSR